MKLKASMIVLIGMLFVLTGYSWDKQSATDSTTTSSNKKNTASTASASATKTYFKHKTATTTAVSSNMKTGSSGTDNRAAAVRMLASGDEATRKARLASLQRLGASAAKKKPK